MAFYKLYVLEDVLNKITDIYAYDPGSGNTRRMICDKYDINNVFSKATAGPGNNGPKQVPFDSVRPVITAMCHLDVETMSIWENDNKTVLENAKFIVTPTVEKAGADVLDAGSPSLERSENSVHLANWSWVYDTSDGSDKTTQWWLIKKISITDNINATSRIDFVFQTFGTSETVKSIITGA